MDRGHPKIIYGTAWKKERTAELVAKALKAGYRAFDTANQMKHYREDFAGEAIRKSGIPRGELFLQSKYTFQAGQDHRLPYDPQASFAEQARQSCESSLRHFGTDYLDGFLLHGPSSPYGLAEADREVWETLQALKREGKVRLIGVSNVGPPHLHDLMSADAKPEIVQNRCYAARGWDAQAREFCLANGVVYEGFSLLTANPQVVEHPRVRELARAKKVSAEQLTLRLAISLGILPLTGTTDENHMREDLEMLALPLTVAEREEILGLTAP